MKGVIMIFNEEFNEIKFHSVNEPVETIIDLFDRRKNQLNSLI